MPCITFARALTALPAAIALLLFFTMHRVTRRILRVRLLVPCLPVLLDLFEVLAGSIWCDRMQNKLWGEIVTAYLNIILLWSVDFVLVDVALLT